MRRCLLSLCFLASLLTYARADVVGFPPASCPRGSIPRTCHGGPHCEIKLCQSDADCYNGEKCQPIQACFGTLNCISRPLPTDATYPPTNIMKSACPDSGYCSVGQACQTEKLCVSPGSDSTETAITTARETSQQTSLATSVTTSTSTDQGTDTAGTKLGDSGCSCRIGDWASAKTIGPWLLAGLFGAVVTLVRRRRGSRK